MSPSDDAAIIPAALGIVQLSARRRLRLEISDYRFEILKG